MGTENWGDVESIIQSLAVYGYEPLPKDDVVSRYQWLKKISEVTESEKIAFMKEHSTTVLWDASGRAIHALARLADVFFNEASTLREQIKQEMIDLGYRLVADEEQMKVTYRTLYGGESKAYLDGDPVGHIYRGTNKHSDEDVLIASVPTSDPELNAWVEIPVAAAIARGEK